MSKVEKYELLTVTLSIVGFLIALVSTPTRTVYLPQMKIIIGHPGPLGAFSALMFTLGIMCVFYTIPMRALLRQRWFRRTFREQTIAYCLLQVYAVLILFYTAIGIVGCVGLLVYSLVA